MVGTYQDEGLVHQLADIVRAFAQSRSLLVAVDGLVACVNAFR